MTQITQEQAAEIDQQDAVAETLVDDLWDRSDEEGTDGIGVAHSLFLWMIHILLEAGFSPDDLHDEVTSHAVIHENPGVRH